MDAPDDLPVAKPPWGEPDRLGPVVGILLAAGTSARFEAGNKLLAAVDGEPVVRRAARSLLESHLDRVIAIVGFEAERIRDAIAGLDLEIVENPAFTDGQSTSVRAGVEAARDDADAILFALGDMPFVAPDSVTALVRAYRAGAGSALAAAFEGERGNPVLFDARYFDALATISGDSGARDVLLGSDDAALIETGDPGVCRDVDTIDDLDGIRD